MEANTNAPPAHIRHATSGDAPRIAELGARIFVDTFGPNNDPQNMHAYVEEAFSVDRVRDELADERSLTLLAEIDGTAVAYARLHAGDAAPGIAGRSPIELVRLYVDSAYHGSGIAATLMQACLDEARGRGHDQMFLGVWEHNARAQAFYRKWGFQHTGEQSFQLGGQVDVDWIMQRPI